MPTRDEVNNAVRESGLSKKYIMTENETYDDWVTRTGHTITTTGGRGLNILGWIVAISAGLISFCFPPFLVVVLLLAYFVKKSGMDISMFQK